MSFKDHFTTQAATYAAFRPRYPDELFSWLASQSGGTELAWDCGTGNGQAAVGLSPWFRHVHATDASIAQLRHAEAPPNVHFACEPAESCSLPDASADLITVAQALHWFDHERFYREAQRVLKPGGLIAAWCYERFELAPELAAILDPLYEETLGPYWPPERRLVETGYRSLAWPFEAIAPPVLALSVEWPLAGLLGYLRSWSATARYQAATGCDPIEAVETRLAAAWGEPASTRLVQWPLAMRVGRKGPGRQA